MKTRVGRTLRITLILIATLVLLVYIIVFRSTSVRSLTCTGTFNLYNGRLPGTDMAFIDMELYRPWVHLWTESDGNMKIQLEKNLVFDYVPFVEKSGDGRMAVFYLYSDRDKSKATGSYLNASSKILLETGGGTFSGECEDVSDKI